MIHLNVSFLVLGRVNVSEDHAEIWISGQPNLPYVLVDLILESNISNESNNIRHFYHSDISSKQAEIWKWPSRESGSLNHVCSGERQDFVSLTVRYSGAAEFKDYTSLNVTNFHGQLGFHSSRFSANQSRPLARPVL